MKRGRVTRVHPDGRKETVAEPGGSPNGLAIGPDGALYVCNSGGWDFYEIGDFTIPQTELPAHHSGGRIERVDLATGDVTVLYTECDGNPLIGPNDLVFDAHGGMWFTDHGRQRRARAAHRRDLLRAARRLVDPRGRVPVRRRRTASACHPTARACTRPRRTPAASYAWNVTGARRGRARPGRARPARMLCGLPGMQLFDSLGIDADGNVVVATLVTGALTVISPGRRGARPGACSATRW